MGENKSRCTLFSTLHYFTFEDIKLIMVHFTFVSIERTIINFPFFEILIEAAQSEARFIKFNAI